MNVEQQPLVSIVIPVYNGANYVHEAIDSALDQTYEKVEVIVVNDGSTDETEQIALSYQERIRYYAKENGGVSTALNTGIRNMRGEYFLWLSHDDLLKPNAIEDMISLLISKPSDGIAYGSFDFINEKSEIYKSLHFAETFPLYLLEWSVFPIMVGISNACVTLIHKRHFERVGMFDENLLYTQDTEMLFKIFRGQSLVYCDDCIGSKRFHEAQGQKLNLQRALESEDKVFCNFITELAPIEMASFSGTVSSFASFINKIYGASGHPLLAERLTQILKDEKATWYSEMLQNKLENSSTAVKKLEADLESVTQVKNTMEVDLQNLFRVKCELEGLLNEVFHSTSWKITAPVRLIGTILRHLKQHGFVDTCRKAYKRIVRK